MNEIRIPSLDELSQIVRTSVSEVCKGFTDPEEDFEPIMHLVSGTGEVNVVQLDARLLDSHDSKDILVHQMMVPLINALGGRLMTVITSAWHLSLDGLSPAEAQAALDLIEREGLGNHPRRTEIVLVNGIGPHRTALWGATINRDHKNPPTLGPWRDMVAEQGEGGGFHGRMVEPLQAALRDSSGVPNAKIAAMLREQ